MSTVQFVPIRNFRTKEGFGTDTVPGTGSLQPGERRGTADGTKARVRRTAVHLSLFQQGKKGHRIRRIGHTEIDQRTAADRTEIRPFRQNGAAAGRAGVRRDFLRPRRQRGNRRFPPGLNHKMPAAAGSAEPVLLPGGTAAGKTMPAD